MTQFNHYTHTLTIAFIAQISDAINDFILHQLSDTFNQPGLIDLIWQLGNNDPAFIFRHWFNMSLSSDFYHTTAGCISTVNPFIAKNHGSSWKIRPLDCCHQLRNFHLRIINQHDQTIYYFAKIMRRNIRSHTNSDTGRTIYQQGWNFSR